MSRSPVIETRGLTKHFGSHRTRVEAVRGLDLSIGAGELVALLGPNGAGKSTTLRMLTTLTPPSSGTARVAGHDVLADPDAVRRAIGYVGQGNGAGHQQRGRDELVSQGRAHGLSRARARERADELVADLDLAAVVDRPTIGSSGGQRRRLDIAMGLVHAPDVLFLDEPSTGLDPQNRAHLQDLVRRLHAERACTVVLTTHYLEEADALAERVVVVDHGRIVADDTATALKSALGDLLVLRLADPAAAARAATRAERLRGRQGQPPSVTVEDREVRVRVAHGREAVAGLVAALAADGDAVGSLEVSGPTLDDVFLALTGRRLREDGPGSERSEETAA
ncbi:ATP-binding cassette domain-containing protein [Nocardioides lentus]|uniref:ATP-binding cassette domain-containing protein n=1 Tax=Nocardioides lentus TaxID=338077 RepID=A0ABP5AIF2_9ACTN